MIQGRLAPAEARPASRQGGPSQLAQQPAQARPASGPTSPAGQPRARGPLPPRAPHPLLWPKAKPKEKPWKLGQRPSERKTLEALQAEPASRPRSGQPAGQPVQQASHERAGLSPLRAPLPLLRPEAKRKEKPWKLGQRPGERINPGSLPGQASQPAKARPASRPISPAGQLQARGPLPPSRSPPAPSARGKAKGKTSEARPEAKRKDEPGSPQHKPWKP